MEYTILTPKSAKELKENILKKSDICPLCGNIIQNPVLDHQHMTSKEVVGENGAGLVRGVLCNLCNIFLGKIENNYKRFRIKDLSLFLKNASLYINKKNLNYVHPSEAFRIKEKLPKSLYNKLIKKISLDKNIDIKNVKERIKYSKYKTKKITELLVKHGLI